MNKSNELLQYLSKFLDEDVSICAEGDVMFNDGTCIEIKPDDNNPDHVVMVIASDNDICTYDIWEYDYKKQTWYDGIRQLQLYIKKK